MIVFITGGMGYVGSHTCVELLNAGHNVVIYDDLSNAHPGVLDRIQRITGKRPTFVKGDVRDAALMEKTLKEHACQSVVHFAGVKAVGESVENPLKYYDINVVGTVRVAQAMAAANVDVIVFSSSATVYGAPQTLPLTEDHPLAAINPYGHTKSAAEGVLWNASRTKKGRACGLLRYFNPVGAHPSGLIGEDPKGIPNNLMPYVAQVAVGHRPFLNVWGNDYATPDGTGIRDYVHVVDLALGHVRALDYLMRTKESLIVNLGTGRGHSVLDVVHAFEKASGRQIPCVFGPRRDGDLPSYYAHAEKAKKLLHWTAEKTLEAMCQDSWRWQSNNPNGYVSDSVTALPDTH